MTVAALYVDLRRGPYPALPGVECWGLPERDATLYAGPHPVIAHPPCGHWGRYHHLARDTGETGPIAVLQVRQWGGVLEHPRDSKLWRFCGLPRPGELPDPFGGYSILIRQCDWGHRAEKATWLYIVGCPQTRLPQMPPPGGPEYRPPCPSGARGICERMASSQRHLTPPALARWLVAAALACHKETP